MFCESQDREEFMFEGLLQPTHLLVIFGIAVLVFGPKKLPELGKAIGEGIWFEICDESARGTPTGKDN